MEKLRFKLNTRAEGRGDASMPRDVRPLDLVDVVLCNGWRSPNPDFAINWAWCPPRPGERDSGALIRYYRVVSAAPVLEE